MKNLFKKIFLILGLIGLTSLVSASTFTSPTYADRLNSTEPCPYILGMVSWDCNVNIKDEETLKSGIWTIVANIATDISVIAAYLIIGYVIYGGYQYIFSAGDPGKIANGKKTLAHGFIGLAIVMLASVILNTIRIALGNANLTANCATGGNCVTNVDEMVINLIRWVISIVGIVSAIFVIYGGISYMTSTGDPGKVKRAKDTIMYALIGLVITALATTITAFVSNLIRDSKDNAFINENIISKEVYENKTS